MSTKIYDGVRFPQVRLGEFVEVMHARHRKVVYRAACAAMVLPESTAAARLDTKGEPDPTPDVATDRHRRADYVTQAARDVERSGARDPFYDLSCGWRIWLPLGSRWALAVPWGERGVRAPIPRWVESYAYWNNSDPPAKLSTGAGYRAWQRRETAWAFACEEATESCKLQLHGYDPTSHMDAAWLYLRLMRYWRPS